MSAAWDRVAFTCNDVPVEVDTAAGESLLSVLRERLGVVSVKDGCAPQGQCGCCTVLVDDDPRVACVTPATRVAGRSVTTLEGIDAAERDALVDAFVASGGSQCGFCTPGILVRAAALRAKGRAAPADLDRALAAHLCRCTGWQTVYESIAGAGACVGRAAREHAARRAELEGGVAQEVGEHVPLGDGGFADDGAPRDALVAVPLPPGSAAPSVEAAGRRWVVADSLYEARTLAAKVQGRRTTAELSWPLLLPQLPDGGVRLLTGWVEPAYLEPDASWCEPGGAPANVLANGGAFGGKETSCAPAAARELADATGRGVRVVFSREDVVRLGPKRPPIAGRARVEGATVAIDGVVAGDTSPFVGHRRQPYVIEERSVWREQRVAGPSTSSHLRAVGLAERVVLTEGALSEAGVDRSAVVRDDRVARVLLDTCACAPSGAMSGARVELDADGTLGRVWVRVAAGDPLDEIVLRSYAIGAAHMALGWVLTEGIAVDSATGEVQDLTIRSFGVIRAKDTPVIDVDIVDDPGEPRARSSDAVFASVAAAVWNAISEQSGVRPERLPARETAAARRLRR
ncbi:MAG TPA: 2Fe-2S iron-sulfur cluster-binding protein [Acidimicrobiia bacterium]|nr:2Fe-2S iron-sulfur cluster-binding protein [Acidimicrobiia bacterium]